jgi:hypothetical protein
MIRLATVLLVAVVSAFPALVTPTVPVTWLASLAFVVGTLGVLVRSMALSTASAALALIAYALALVVGRAASDPLAAAVFGGVLVALLALAHLAARTDGAWLGPAVVAVQVRQWLASIVLGLAAALMLTTTARLLALALAGAALPTVVVAAALGAVLAVAGAVALTTRRGSS